MQALEALFYLAIVTRVRYDVAIRVGIECSQSHINTHGFASRHVLQVSFCLHSKLQVVAISTPHQAYPLDLLAGKGFDIARANEPKATNPTAIREGDMLAIRFQLPSCGFVLDAASGMLKLG